MSRKLIRLSRQAWLQSDRETWNHREIRALLGLFTLIIALETLALLLFALQVRDNPHRLGTVVLIGFLFNVLYAAGAGFFAGRDSRGGIPYALMFRSPVSVGEIALTAVLGGMGSLRHLPVLLLLLGSSFGWVFCCGTAWLISLPALSLLYAGTFLSASLRSSSGQTAVSELLVFLGMLIFLNPGVVFSGEVPRIRLFTHLFDAGILRGREGFGWVIPLVCLLAGVLLLLAFVIRLILWRSRPGTPSRRIFRGISSPWKGKRFFDVESLWNSGRILPAFLLSIGSPLVIRGVVDVRVWVVWLALIAVSLLFYSGDLFYFDRRLVEEAGRVTDGLLIRKKTWTVFLLLVFLFLPPTLAALAHGSSVQLVVWALALALCSAAAGRLSTSFLYQSLPSGSASPGGLFFAGVFFPLFFLSGSRYPIPVAAVFILLGLPVLLMTRESLSSAEKGVF